MVGNLRTLFFQGLEVVASLFFRPQRAISRLRGAGGTSSIGMVFERVEKMKFKMLAVLCVVSASLVARAEDAKKDEAPAAPAAPAAGGAAVQLGDATKGKEVFEGRAVPAANCTLCHGAGGKGDGVAAAAYKTLGAAPRDFTNKAEMDKIPNEEIITAITEGGAAVHKSPFMAAWKAMLSAEQIKDVAAYVRSFSK